MPNIFISYRRDESAGYAGRIHERLATLYGSDAVFMDFDDISPGMDFVRTIENRLSSCQVLIVLIGKRWLSVENAEGARRIDDANDFVRVEIATALARKAKTIPVLLNNASMPSEKDLPPDIRMLARHQAVELSDERWDYDLSQLVKALGGAPVARKTGRRVFALSGLAVVAVAAALLWRLSGGQSSAEISGRWVAEVPYEFSAPQAERFVFEQMDNGLIGTASFLKVDRGILEGVVDGDRITFLTRTSEFAGDETRETIHRYQGKIEGDSIQFVMQTEGGFSSHPPIKFAARKSSP